MITITWRAKLTFLVGLTLMATGLTLAFAGAGAGAAATPHTAAAQGGGGGKAPGGDNGTVKIHRSTTPVTDPRNQPHVCVFYLDAFGFDPAQSVSWQIKSWPPTGDRSVVSSGVLTLDSNGLGHTGDMTLLNGHYKLFWNFTGEHGFAKQKVFWVACPAPTPTPTTPSESETSSPTESSTPSPSESTMSTSTATPSPTPPPSSSSGPPGGGLPVTGWPLALIAVGGATLLGSGGAAIAMTRRRRGMHSG